MTQFHFFVWLKNIQLHICAASSLSIPQQVGVYVASMSWLFVNGAATNIWVHVSFEIMAFSRYMPSSGIVGSNGSPIFSFIKLKYF